MDIIKTTQSKSHMKNIVKNSIKKDKKSIQKDSQKTACGQYIVAPLADNLALALAEISTFFEIECVDDFFIVYTQSDREKKSKRYPKSKSTDTIKQNETILSRLANIHTCEQIIEHFPIEQFLTEQFLTNAHIESIKSAQFKAESYKVIMNAQFTNFISMHGQQAKQSVFRYFFNLTHKAKVSMHKPQYEFCIYATQTTIYLCQRLLTNTKDYLSRKGHLRPVLHPTTLSPRLARSMINLCGITTGTIFDPCCGTGGILLESLDLRFKTIGADIDQKMIERAEKTLKHYFPQRKYYLKQADATQNTTICDAIVTDLPYGKNTSKVATSFYQKFFAQIAQMTKRAVVCTPHFLDVKSILPSMWKIKHTIFIPVHKSLVRIIYVLERE